MEATNDSSDGDFILVGFSEHPELELIISLFVLILYSITLVGNVAIISLSILDARLHTPMYFFLRNLSVLDLSFTTSIVPQMLVNMWGGNKKISYAGCMVQYWVALALGSTECVLLAVMEVDRYVAVCWPLHYTTIMHPKLCHLLAAASWSSGFANSFLQSSMAIVLPLCGNRRVDHFFCELLIIVKLSCVDTGPTESKMFIANHSSCACLHHLDLLCVYCQGSRENALSRGKEKGFWDLCFPPYGGLTLLWDHYVFVSTTKGQLLPGPEQSTCSVLHDSCSHSQPADLHTEEQGCEKSS